jgi:hypothetical protein
MLDIRRLRADSAVETYQARHENRYIQNATEGFENREGATARFSAADLSRVTLSARGAIELLGRITTPEPRGIGKQLANARLEVVGGTQCVLRVSSRKVSAKPHCQTLGTPAGALGQFFARLAARDRSAFTKGVRWSSGSWSRTWWPTRAGPLGIAEIPPAAECAV